WRRRCFSARQPSKCRSASLHCVRWLRFVVSCLRLRLATRHLLAPSLPWRWCPHFGHTKSVGNVPAGMSSCGLRRFQFVSTLLASRNLRQCPGAGSVRANRF
ncbi:hypothetical protein DQ04_22881000, partial [Trypanosoma grayi]|uniref:hypothetical protein n=1 Tax=Trypanosoma grayi TaxID=71804 RepID=UPI0004F3FA18